MEIGICSYSFHRLLAAGKQDIFRFIVDCKELGCSQLDPWNAHLELIKQGDATARPGASEHLSKAEERYLTKVKDAADAVEMPFGLIAVDGAHVYEGEPQKRNENRARAYRWLDVARHLGARQIRIDSGGPEVMTSEIFKVIEEGYQDLIERATRYNIEVVVENHLGPTLLPENILTLVQSIDGLGLLLDTQNWKPGKKAEGLRDCAKYATAVHVKTLKWDDQGNEIMTNPPAAIRSLQDAGYSGCWGIESCPEDGDEYGAARRSVALLRKLVH